MRNGFPRLRRRYKDLSIDRRSESIGNDGGVTEAGGWSLSGSLTLAT